jgi:hypothetical protein
LVRNVSKVLFSLSNTVRLRGAPIAQGEVFKPEK